VFVNTSILLIKIIIVVSFNFHYNDEFRFFFTPAEFGFMCLTRERERVYIFSTLFMTIYGAGGKDIILIIILPVSKKRISISSIKGLCIIK
jgi:hypothetical protein